MKYQGTETKFLVRVVRLVHWRGICLYSFIITFLHSYIYFLIFSCTHSTNTHRMLTLHLSFFQHSWVASNRNQGWLSVFAGQPLEECCRTRVDGLREEQAWEGRLLSTGGQASLGTTVTFCSRPCERGHCSPAILLSSYIKTQSADREFGLMVIHLPHHSRSVRDRTEPFGFLIGRSVPEFVYPPRTHAMGEWLFSGEGFLCQQGFPQHTGFPCVSMQEGQEVWVRSLCWEDPLEEGMATNSSILAWRILWTEKPGGYSPQRCKELDTTKVTQHTHTEGRQMETPSYLPLITSFRQ